MVKRKTASVFLLGDLHTPKIHFLFAVALELKSVTYRLQSPGSLLSRRINGDSGHLVLAPVVLLELPRPSPTRRRLLPNVQVISRLIPLQWLTHPCRLQIAMIHQIFNRGLNYHPTLLRYHR